MLLASNRVEMYIPVRKIMSWEEDMNCKVVGSNTFGAGNRFYLTKSQDQNFVAFGSFLTVSVQMYTKFE